jgi:hypothetical protein
MSPVSNEADIGRAAADNRHSSRRRHGGALTRSLIYRRREDEFVFAMVWREFGIRIRCHARRGARQEDDVQQDEERPVLTGEICSRIEMEMAVFVGLATGWSAA